jgi:hypothetical protein
VVSSNCVSEKGGGGMEGGNAALLAFALFSSLSCTTADTGISQDGKKPPSSPKNRNVQMVAVLVVLLSFVVHKWSPF